MNNVYSLQGFKKKRKRRKVASPYGKQPATPPAYASFDHSQIPPAPQSAFTIPDAVQTSPSFDWDNDRQESNSRSPMISTAPGEPALYDAYPSPVNVIPEPPEPTYEDNSMSGVPVSKMLATIKRKDPAYYNFVKMKMNDYGIDGNLGAITDSTAGSFSQLLTQAGNEYLQYQRAKMAAKLSRMTDAQRVAAEQAEANRLQSMNREALGQDMLSNLKQYAVPLALLVAAFVGYKMLKRK